MSETENRVSFEITRFDPDRDEVPKQQTYEIPVEPDWKVLDAINYIKENVDSSISHRWSFSSALGSNPFATKWMALRPVNLIEHRRRT